MDRVRSRRLLLALLCSVLTAPGLVGCSSDDPADTADDAAQDPTPTAPPAEGLPDFAPQTYSYTLEVTCYCVDAGRPVRVTVVDDEVTEAVYLRGGPGVRKGATAGEASHLTIDDIIARAEDPDAAVVEVDWPEGQDHPRSVRVDPDERIVDEEVGYRISDVEIH